MVIPATKLSEVTTNWEGGPSPAWYPHAVGCECRDCEEGLRGKPILARPPIVRLMGEQIGPTKAAKVPETTIRAENKRIRKQRLTRIALAMQGMRTRNRRAVTE